MTDTPTLSVKDAPADAQVRIRALESLARLFGHTKIILITVEDGDCQMVSGMDTQETVEVMLPFIAPYITLMETPDGESIN